MLLSILLTFPTISKSPSILTSFSNVACFCTFNTLLIFVLASIFNVAELILVVFVTYKL